MLVMLFRTIAIWIFGLLASAIIGSLIASRVQPPYAYDWGFAGGLAGICAFACLRLWLGDDRSKKPE
jgi:hypothetical protein